MPVWDLFPNQCRYVTMCGVSNMIEIQIPQNLEEHKTKIIFGLSMRQLVCVFVAIVIVIAEWTGFLKDLDWKAEGKIILSAVTIIPVLIFGFIKIQEQPVEIMLGIVIRENLLAPGVRKKEIHYPEIEKWEKDVYKFETEEERKERLKKNKSAFSSGNNKIEIKRSKEFKRIK